MGKHYDNLAFKLPYFFIMGDFFLFFLFLFLHMPKALY